VLLDGEPPGRSDGVDIDEDANGVLRDDPMYQLVGQHAAIRDRTLEISLPSARRRGVLVHVRLAHAVPNQENTHVSYATP